MPNASRYRQRFRKLPWSSYKKGLGEDSKYIANLIFLKLIPEENGFLVVEESKKLVRGDRRSGPLAADVWKREGSWKNVWNI